MPDVYHRITMLAEAGFVRARLRSHGYVQARDAAYLLSVVDRGAMAQAGAGRVGDGLVEALKAEARRRVDAGTFFGHIAYASVIARTPVRHSREGAIE